ncbi:hypothetical protein BDA96_04G067700 [Sorghum bicolor]|jgi:hypothetical protein|uniref:FAS1 domain-containing protein n=2 Tax=Sorghum bicolor TaxID=4558 RepID=A0A921UH49_SORBI|nr:fasciclin-like arabinogalactan protein 3 [Sorghum bicolor]EES04622.1 hypothetical protein SORBI_3004G062300 [Sorghum bicolor]KAG0531972.1 hypothetical protein BDA96_04G067700 [Sorghum bicolor]|eukprot:XP_002451646.1 fasciclin-like arabinogalactan protein 3 [Sorghum bicolor]
MAPFLHLLLVLLAVLLPVPIPSLGAGYGEGADTIDITKILAGFPEFSSFSAMLNETSVAAAIKSRDKVTVLAPNNTAVAVAFGGLPKIPRSFLADLLALHVVLDYIDEPTLGALKRGRIGQGSVVTTLLQAMRAVPRGTGFLRVFSGPDGRATISSAAPAGQRNATVDRVVAAEPYSLAVLQVSGFVVPPGVRVPKPFPPPRASPPGVRGAPKPFPPPMARHMAAPPGRAPAAAPGPHHEPFIGSGPLVPSPIRPMPTPSLTNGPPAAPGTGVIPIPTHGGMASKVPSAAGAGRSAATWWTGVAVALGIMTCLNLHL